MFSSNNNEEQQKTHKPLPLSGKVPLRTVSAQPTFNEVATGTAGGSSSAEKTDLKLNINASVFVPKEKRTDVGKSDKENTPSTTGAPLTTTTQQGGSYSTQGTMPPSGYSSQQGQYPSGQYGKGSMVGYTYLNNQMQMPQMYQPMQAPYTGYSPNTQRPGQFFHSNYPNPMGFQPYSNYKMQGSSYPMQGSQMGQMTTPISQPTSTTTTATSTTPLSTATSTEKKILFNKNATIFLPKSLRKEGEEKVADMKISEPAEKVKVEELADKVEVPVEKKEKEIVPEIKEVQLEKPEKVVSQDQLPEVEGKKLQAVVEDKKPSKLKDLLFSTTTSAKQPAGGPKNAPVKKTVTPTSTVVVTSKPKQSNDIQRSLDEKRKLLFNKQKEEKLKPPVTVQPKKPERTMEKEPIKKDDSYDETPVPSDSEESEEQLKKNLKLERFYFLVDESKAQEKVKHVYNIDYLLSFSKWQICQENKLLGDMLKGHIEAMNIYEDERPKGYKGGHKDKKPMADGGKFTINKGANVYEDNLKDKMAFTRSSVAKSEPQLISTASDGQTLGKWGRKDMSEAERIAKEFREKFEEERKKDPVRNELTELLNILTVDNYEEVKLSIYKKIQGNEEDQYKFLDVLFKKAVSEKAFVSLYAKIAKDLDREMPQKTEKDQRISKMRSKLIDKCREIFKTEGNTKIDHISKVIDPQEKEAKLKKFLLGNVNFIGELINAKLLSKRIVFQCIDNLFLRIDKVEGGADSNLVKQINLEAIVILIDKFGTLINKHDPKMKGTDDLNEFNKKIDDYLCKLDDMQENDKTIPGHIRYKIINLEEKRNRGWEESKVDKTSTAKGIKEVREEYETEQRGPTARGSIKLDQEQVNSKIKEDLYAWRDHCKNGYQPEDYHWEITEALVKKHKNTLSEILTGFGETCIDFVSKKEDIQYAYSYIRELITYYAARLDKKSAAEILDVTLFFLQNLSDLLLDNNLLAEVWGGVIYLLEYFKIFTFSDLEKLKDVEDEQLKTIFQVVNIALGYTDDREEEIKELYNISLVKANKTLFQSIVEQP